jgi:hypothetical protein
MTDHPDQRKKRRSPTAWGITGLLSVALGGMHLACPPVAAQDAKLDLNAPGPEHRRLDALAGRWDVALTIPAGPERTVEGKATCEAQWALDGRFMRVEYTSTFADKPLTVVRYVGFDRHKSQFVEVQFESTHTDVMMSTGTISSDGKTITTRGKHRDSASGEEVEVRSVTTLVDRDAFTLQMTYGDGDGARTITLKHQRSKPR